MFNIHSRCRDRRINETSESAAHVCWIGNSDTTLFQISMSYVRIEHSTGRCSHKNQIILKLRIVSYCKHKRVVNHPKTPGKK